MIVPDHGRSAGVVVGQLYIGRVIGIYPVHLVVVNLVVIADYDVLPPVDMDPVLYNILNGCWLCNYEQQEFDNQYLCNRNFYYPDPGEVRCTSGLRVKTSGFNPDQIKPCNPYSFIPKNSADDL